MINPLLLPLGGLSLFWGRRGFLGRGSQAAHFGLPLAERRLGYHCRDGFFSHLRHDLEIGFPLGTYLIQVEEGFARLVQEFHAISRGSAGARLGQDF